MFFLCFFILIPYYRMVAFIISFLKVMYWKLTVPVWYLFICCPPGQVYFQENCTSAGGFIEE